MKIKNLLLCSCLIMTTTSFAETGTKISPEDTYIPWFSTPEDFEKTLEVAQSESEFLNKKGQVRIDNVLFTLDERSETVTVEYDSGRKEKYSFEDDVLDIVFGDSSDTKYELKKKKYCKSNKKEGMFADSIWIYEYGLKYRKFAILYKLKAYIKAIGPSGTNLWVQAEGNWKNKKESGTINSSSSATDSEAEVVGYKSSRRLKDFDVSANFQGGSYGVALHIKCEK